MAPRIIKSVYRLEFPAKLVFARSTYPWQRATLLAFYVSWNYKKSTHLFLKLLMGREAHITFLSCTDFKQFLCERFREISV